MKRIAVLVLLSACGSPPCALPAGGTIVRRDGAATLTRWDLDDAGALFTAVLPDDPHYRAFRARVTADGAELRTPIADRPEPKDAAEREMWRREDHNAHLVTSGRAGTLRPVRCLEALAFHPDRESIVLVLRRETTTRIYLGRSDQMFPPKSVYGTDEAAEDVAAGWRFEVVLHNHTRQHRGDRVALGMPTLSTADVSLFRNLAVGSAWVTNGVYTAEVRATDLPLFLGRDD